MFVPVPRVGSMLGEVEVAADPIGKEEETDSVAFPVHVYVNWEDSKFQQICDLTRC